MGVLRRHKEKASIIRGKGKKLFADDNMSGKLSIQNPAINLEMKNKILFIRVIKRCNTYMFYK
jgi:hypothetical protein